MKKFLTLGLTVLLSLALACPAFAKGSRSGTSSLYTGGKSYSSKSSYGSGKSYSSKSRVSTPRQNRETSIRSYTKKDGTHVEAHKRTTPNKTQQDNWSTKSNVNPYTGKKGTKEARR